MASKIYAPDGTIAAHGNASSTSINPDDKKAVLIAGTNAAAHYILRDSLDNLGDKGIHCDVYLTDPLSKPGTAYREKLTTPEALNFTFYERLMIDYGYSIIERHNMCLDADGDLRSDIMYTPQQLSNFFATREAEIRIQNLLNVNDPGFVQRIDEDDDIIRVTNIRGMQIIRQPLINAVKSKKWKDKDVAIVNAHPGNPLLFPGTYIAFHVRMQGSDQNTWVIHQIKDDAKVDSGPILDERSKRLKPHKTLIQDMLTMRSEVGSMVSADITNALRGIPSIGRDQHEYPGFDNKPEENFSYPEHEQWLKAHEKGIRAVNPRGLIDAFVKDYTGDPGRQVARDLNFGLSTRTHMWQVEYMDTYTAKHRHDPPEYTENPDGFWVKVPGKPLTGKIYGPAGDRKNKNLPTTTVSSHELGSETVIDPDALKEATESPPNLAKVQAAAITKTEINKQREPSVHASDQTVKPKRVRPSRGAWPTSRPHSPQETPDKARMPGGGGGGGTSIVNMAMIDFDVAANDDPLSFTDDPLQFPAPGKHLV